MLEKEKIEFTLQIQRHQLIYHAVTRDYGMIHSDQHT